MVGKSTSEDTSPESWSPTRCSSIIVVFRIFTVRWWWWVVIVVVIGTPTEPSPSFVGGSRSILTGTVCVRTISATVEDEKVENVGQKADPNDIE